MLHGQNGFEDKLMNKPILSICIPTKNRANYLDITLFKLTQESIFQNTNDIEIIISDNASIDNTAFICKKYKNKYPDKIKYYKQNKDIGDKNFIEVLKLATGSYAKLNNDNLQKD